MESSKIIMIVKQTMYDELYAYRTAEKLQSTDTRDVKSGETDMLPTKGRD